MNPDNRTDKFFQNQLEHYSSSVSADMWGRITGKKKKKFLFLLFWLAGFFILATGIGATFFFLKSRQVARVAIPATKTEPKILSGDTVKTTHLSYFSGKGQDESNALKANRGEPSDKLGTSEYHSKRANPEPRKTSYHKNGGSFETEDGLTVAVSSDETAQNNEAARKDSAGGTGFIKDSAGKSMARVLQDSAGNAAPGKQFKKPATQKDTNQRKWFLDLWVSPDYPIVSNAGNAKAKLSYSLGIKLNRTLGEHFSVKTGIQFSRINIGGDSLFQAANIQLSRLDVPILAGYSVGDQTFKTTFNAGAILNLITWNNGNVGPDYFRKNTGMSLYLGMNLEKKIDKRVSVFFEPYYRYQLSPMTTNRGGSMEFIHVAGINIGGRYFFR